MAKQKIISVIEPTVFQARHTAVPQLQSEAFQSRISENYARKAINKAVG